ncbi:MAG: hypothetical protein HZB40_02585 [Rhodocyclales bacterium]|nr:hypothetical protein [Rhodocyclales bacterium]
MKANTWKVIGGFSRGLSLLCTATVVVALTGCAHPLAIGPDITKIEPGPDSPVIDANVGYYIAPEIRDSKVTTPGGGGDLVTYAPYSDLEVAFYKMLGNVFKNVVPLKSTSDRAELGDKAIRYVITPTVKTDSSSPSPFTWPPTAFYITLTCRIADPEGNVLATPTVTAAGRAEYEEFKSDFSLSGKRAAVSVMQQMQKELQRLPQLAK